MERVGSVTRQAHRQSRMPSYKYSKLRGVGGGKGGKGGEGSEGGELYPSEPL